MYEVSKRNKTIFLIIGLVLLLAGVFVGTYFLLQKYMKKENFLDKHGDVVSLCDREKGTSIYKCNLLLEDLVPNIEGKTCFDVQIISNETIVPTRFCEEEQYLTLSNEIVQFKKLKPLTVTFTYISNKLSNILFEPISETYIQDLVNRDIESLIRATKESLGLYANSFDFCPKPSSLPDYVLQKNQYEQVYNNIILTKQEYEDSSLIKFLPCLSSHKLNFNLCNSTNKYYKTELLDYLNNISLDTLKIRWDKTISVDDDGVLSALTYLHDLTFGFNSGTVEDIQKQAILVNDYFGNIDSMNGLQLCVLNDIFTDIDSNTESKGAILLNSLILNNIDKNIPSLCFNNMEDLIDKNGLYIKGLFSNISGYSVINKCFNLSLFLE